MGPCGFFICESCPFLGATPDGTVYDPSNSSHPFGCLEVKCPYSHRDRSPAEACTILGFCSQLQTLPDGSKQVMLRKTTFTLLKFKDRWLWEEELGVIL